MTTHKTPHRALAILKLPTPVPALITYSQSIVTKMTGNPSFPTPTPTLAAVSAAITDLNIAETAALSRAKGTASVRNEKRKVLFKLLQQLLGYIQTVADGQVDSETSIIESAGVAVKKSPAHTARVFGAKPGPVSGSVKLTTVVAGRRASYEWQTSTDGGKTWVLAPTTIRSTTVIAGFTPGSTVYFRSRPVTGAGEGNWSQPVSLIVV
jgi:hypothetical protein